MMLLIVSCIIANTYPEFSQIAGQENHRLAIVLCICVFDVVEPEQHRAYFLLSGKDDWELPHTAAHTARWTS